MKKNFRIDEVAEELRVSKRTVYRLIDIGELCAFKIFRRTLVPVEAIAAYRERQIEKFKIENGFIDEVS